jgi:hypothetical protein
MPTDLSDLLAPRESVRKAFFLLSNIPIKTRLNVHIANKELKKQ